MSNCEPAGQATDFEIWVADEFGRIGDFTALVVLVAISADKVVPVCSTYLHVVGLETDWNEIVVLFAGSGHEWDGASFFPHTAPEGGPLDNPAARLRLIELEARIDADPLVLNEGGFFDKWGRRLNIEATGLQ